MAVFVGVIVGVFEGVGVTEGVAVWLGVGVMVGVGVTVGVGVGVPITGVPPATAQATFDVAITRPSKPWLPSRRLTR